MMKPKVNLNCEKVDPMTELGLSLGYSTLFSRPAVRNDPSAGANAGSLSFVAANRVSELVWSPQGLSLKYADCSFVDGQSSSFLGVGPSNMAISTSQAEKVDHANIESTKGDIVTHEGKGPINEANANKVAPDVGDLRNRDRNSNYDLLDQAETTSKPREKTPLAVPGQNVMLLQDKPDPGDCISHEKASGYSSKKQVMKVPHLISPMDNGNAINGGIMSHLVENEQAGNPSIPLLEKLESMDENDVKEPDCQIAGAAEMKSAVSESSSEVKSESMHGPQNHLEKLTPTRNHLLENSRVLENHSADKGRASFNSDAENHSVVKGRASFNTDADGRLLKEKNDSWESVESCNHAIMDKKRWHVDEPLFIGSKRAKHVHNQPSSSGFCGQNSSFVNWISNMMKGLSRPTIDIDAGAPLSFAFADPSDSLDDVTHTHMSEQNVRYTGFKSFFQKLYQPSQTAQEIGFPVTANEARIESSLAGGSNEVCTICANPTQRQEGTDGVRKQLLLSNKEFNEDVSVVGSGPSSLPLGIHGHISVYKGESGAYSGEDKVLVNKDALIMSGSSPSEQKTLKADLTEVKAPQFGCKGDFRTFWINRFSSKAPCSLLKLDEATRDPGGATDGNPNSGRTLVQSPQLCGSEKKDFNASPNEYRNESLLGNAGNELPNCHVNTESSIGFKRAVSYRDEDNVRKVDVMLPSKCLKSSDEMAPTFARRLDALRRNIPPKSSGDDKLNVPCFFCGMMGHQLRVCTKVAKSDLKGLLTSIHPHEASNMSPACIKCFQLNHWAISCPHKQVQDSEQDGGLSHAVSVQNERNLLKNCHVKGNRNSKRKAVSASGTLTRAREDEDVSTATNQKDQTEITAGCDFVPEKISEAPKGIFDLIKMLLLSRTDIVKWMNSGASLIHLDGYFLRLRLGKWGDGLGGRGYRVARISGMTQIDRLPVNGKIFVYVNVGGVKCLVGSQYISNHDFLEDELKAWWCTSKGEGKMPSKDELRYKVEERRRLGI